MIWRNLKSIGVFVTVIIISVAVKRDASAQATDMRWIFGNAAGMDFTAGDPAPFLVPAPDDIGFNAYEGCAGVCDETGALLFFTNGQKVWNREYNVMPNGSSIIPMGALVGSTTQAAAIVPVPGSDARYYVLSLEEQGMPGRLYYTLVDMSLNGGLGDVVAEERGVLLGDGLTEKMMVAPGKCKRAWVIVRARAANEYRAFAVTEAGLDTDPVISVTGDGPLESYITGTLKCSSDGKRIAATLFPRPPENITGIELYDFDGATGALSNAALLMERVAGPLEAGYYGLCFSPDNTKLYAGSHFPNTIHQFDISLPTIDAMRASETLIDDMGVVIPGDMRTGPDGKLYIAAFEKNYLNRIDFPDVAGSACGFVSNAVVLPFGASCMLGLPAGNITASSGAIYDTITSNTHSVACTEALLSCPAAEGPYVWSTGETTKAITVTAPGTYAVVSRSSCQVMVDSFTVSFIDPPASLLGNDTTVCAGSAVALAVTSSVPDHFTFSWNTGAAGRTINVTAPGRYIVTASFAPCMVTDSLEVTYQDCDCHLEVPSAFSPNGDGVNDIFLPVGSAGCQAVAGYSLSVYNRWGESVFSSNAMSRGWNGLHSGKPVEVGVYFYTLSYTDRYNKLQQRKGDIMVIR